MIDPTHLLFLERMASISPGVRMHIGGKLWVENIDEDEITPRLILNECFAIMIGEAYELGLEFYCPLPDLCDTLYHLDKVLLLFEVVFPTPLYRSITENAFFKSWLHAAIVDGVDSDETSPILCLLSYLAHDHPATVEIFTDTYLFLHDKLKSTPVFDQYVESLYTIDTIPYQASVDAQELRTYLDHIAATTTQYLHVADLYVTQYTPTEEAKDRLYAAIDLYRRTAIAAETLSNYTWRYLQTTHISSQPLDTLEQAICERLTQQFNSNVPLYDLFYTVRAEKPSVDAWVALILGCLETTITQQAFLARVDALFGRLSEGYTVLTEDQRTMLKRIALTMAQEIHS